MQRLLDLSTFRGSLLVDRLMAAGIVAALTVAPDVDVHWQPSGPTADATVWLASESDLDRANEIVFDFNAQQRYATETCTGCGYDLRGHEEHGACPECGRDFWLPTVDIACASCGEFGPPEYDVCWSCGGNPTA